MLIQTYEGYLRADQRVCTAAMENLHAKKDGIPFAGIGDLDEQGEIVTDSVRRVSPRVLDEHASRYRLSGNSIGFGRVASIGKVIDFQESVSGIAISPTMAVIEPRSIDRKYLVQALRSSFVRGQIDRLLTGTTRSSLGIELLRSLNVPIPPNKEPEKIGLILTTIDNAIRQTEALIAKYQQIKAGLMHDLFTRGLSPEASAKGDVTWTLRPTRSEAPHLYKESPIGWIPKEWEIVPVEDLCSDIVDCPHSTPTYVQSGIPCIRTADMQPGELLLEQVYRVTEEEYGERVARLVPQKGDVIYSREGERLGIASPVGKERVCLGQRVMLLRPSSITDPDFLVWAMNTPVFYRRIVAGLGATTSPHVNVGDIRKAMLSRPSSAEQMMIGKLLARQTILLSAEEFQLSKLRQVKHGLMHDLLTGRVRVKVSGVATTSAR